MNPIAATFRRVVTTHAAWPILITIALLCTASVMALSLDVANPDRAGRQETFIAIGVGLMCLMMLPHYEMMGRLAYVALGVAVLLLMAVMLAPMVAYTHRWFVLPGGFQLQPSEFAKIAFVLAMAWYLRHRKNVREITGLFVPFLMMLGPFGLILIEPDLGTALLFPAVLYSMLIAAGARFRHLLVIALVVMFALPGAYPFLRPYQKDRLLNLGRHLMGRSAPNATLNEDFQPHQSVVAIGSGGASGQGVEGAEHLQQGVLPEAFTDFVFAGIGIRWGFVGCACVLFFYLAFFGTSMEIASSARDGFGRLMVVGLASMILFQALVNAAMAVRLVPVVGIALPFVSYGGSSLLANFLAAGLVLNVSLRR